MRNAREKEVRAVITQEAKKYGPPIGWYFKSSLIHLGNVPMPIQRAIHQKGFSFSTKSYNEQRKIWSDIWRCTNCFEVRTQALLFFQSKKAPLDLEDWKILMHWTKQIDNWAHSDGLSSLYAQLFEEYPSTLIPVLRKWSKSALPWERRQSLVSLFYYSSLRKKRVPSFPTVQSFLLKLLIDEDLYVQKGLGWTLRESYNVYPQETLHLLHKIVRELPAAAWQAATEKLSAKDKACLKKERQARH